MKKYISWLLLTCLLPVWLHATEFANETFRYKVEYKWGLISKVAGYVNVSLTNTPDRYRCQLVGASASWADRYFMVRDTLRGEILKNGFAPVFYEKMAHEGNERKYDYVSYRREGNHVYGITTRRYWEKGKLDVDTTQVLEAEGMTLDILTSYFYMRSLPYGEWNPGHKTRVNIFSGKWKEILTITYIGDETVEYDKKKYDCWHIRFSFTRKGGKKSSDDMDAWIDRTGNHIPVRMEGKLPIGKIRCFYIGN